MEQTVEKKQEKAKRKTVSLKLQTETLHRLEASHLREAIGGARIWKPVGFTDDTTPIHDDTPN
jgi:hypothetical protein